MKKHLLLVIVFFTILANKVSGTPDFTQPFTLSELVDIALENNPTTKQAWWNAKRAAAALGVAKSSYYPNISLKANATNGRDYKFINGPDTSYTIVGADLFLNLMLYDFGERSATVNMAKSALMAANWRVDWTIQRVVVNVLEAAYTTLYAQEVLQASESSLRDAEKVLNAAKELNRTGLTPISDVYTTQATLSQMKMDLAQHRAFLDIQRGKLAASLGFCANTQIEIVIPEPLHGIHIEQIDKLIQIALVQRSDLIAKQARLQETLFNQMRARSAYFPKLSFSSRGGYNHYFQDKSDSAQYQVSLNVEVPIFNGFDMMYKNRIAYADTQISNEELVELQLDIALEVLTYSRTLLAAQEMISDAEENLNNSLKAYEGVLDKYKAGKEGIVDLSYAQRQLAAARIRYSDVKTKLLVSTANLAYATGTLVPYMETSCENPL